MSDELKDCPFCASARVECRTLDGYANTEIKHTFKVCCYGCNASMWTYRYKEEAIAAWNTRTQDKTIAKQEDKIKELVGAIEIYFAAVDVGYIPKELRETCEEIIKDTGGDND